jgi:hypothetical protein
MPIRINGSRGSALLVSVSLLACAPASSSSYRNAAHASTMPSMTAASRVIDAERIARSGSQTAFDAVRAFVPRYRLDAIVRGVSLEGDASAAARSTLGIVLDGHPVAELDALRSIPASQVVAIHVLSASDATVRFGPGYNGGAIVVQTWMSFR